MKQPKPDSNWFFVDESGDPTFYDRSGNLIVNQKGCSPILILGFMETQQPETIRQAIQLLQNEVVGTPHFKHVPSLAKTADAFHAKNDLPEIRHRVFKLLADLDFKAQFVVARKIERVFRNSFDAREEKFYDHLVTQLFKNTLHRYQQNRIYFSKRGSRSRQIPLFNAIRSGVARFEQQWNTRITSEFVIQAQTPKGEPCLSVIDYMNWAVYRAFTHNEMRYYHQVEHHISLLVDLYDTKNYPKNWYNRKNPFHTNKITPLQLDPVTGRTA